MFISDKQKSAGRTALTYLFVTVFTALFGAIYERFSHEVYSYFMIYAFAVPLLLGVLPYSIMAFKGKTLASVPARNLIHAGVSTLTVGSVVKGVLDIFGTTNYLAVFYPIIGGALIFCGICTALFGKCRRQTVGKNVENAE